MFRNKTKNMWKFYIILTLWTLSVNGQCGYYTPCTSNKAIKSSALFPQYADTAEPNTLTKLKRDTKLPLTKELQNSSATFNYKLFDIMSLGAQNQNLVYSPLSLQVLLSFIYTISDGKLYEQLRQLLVVPNDRTLVVNSIQTLMSSLSVNTSSISLIMANKLYYDQRFGRVSDNVLNLTFNGFAAELEEIDFLQPTKAASLINTWVSDKTHQLIRDIILPSAILPDTSAVLLNSLYFKSEWFNKFASYDTKVQQFYVSKKNQSMVNMMVNEDDEFRYGEIEDLQASVVELPYETSDLNMMLILPKDIEGLYELERKLSRYSLESLSQQLRLQPIVLKMPKFEIELEVDMISPLQKLGLHALFNKDGELKLFKDQPFPLKVDQMKHKTYIKVNEDGTEAASTTFARLVPHILTYSTVYFVADHPFVFVIRNSNTVFFMGHYVGF